MTGITRCFYSFAAGLDKALAVANTRLQPELMKVTVPRLPIPPALQRRGYLPLALDTPEGWTRMGIFGSPSEGIEATAEKLVQKVLQFCKARKTNGILFSPHGKPIDTRRLPPHLMISVTTNNGVVTLTGTVASKEESHKVVRMVKDVPGVTSVDNQLTISNS